MSYNKYEAEMEIYEKLSLEPKMFVVTTVGWEAIITDIDSTKFNHGMGLRVIRVGDNAVFHIPPSMVEKILE